MAKTATAPAADEATTLSPLEQIAALQAQLKELKSSASDEMKKDAESKFLPLHEQMTSAFAAITDGDNPERAAQALKWVGENITDYRRMGRMYHKHVFGVAAPRKPREPKSDVAATDADAA